MKELQKVVGSLLVTMLTMVGVVSLAGTAYAAAYHVVQAESRFWYESVQGHGVGAWYWCDPAVVSEMSTYQVVPRPESEGGGWVSLREDGNDQAALVWVFISGSIYATSADAIDMSDVRCGGVTFTRFIGQCVEPGIDGLTFTHHLYGSGNPTPCGAWIGQSGDGRYFIVNVNATRVHTNEPPFTPETDDKSPVAAPDAGVVPDGTTSVRVSVLDNDDLPNGVKHLEVVIPPAHGTATVDFTSADWPIDYVPNEGFVGRDIFTYRVTDNLDKVSETTVVIDVLGATTDPPTVNDPPTVVDPPAVPPQVSDPAPEPFRAATGIEASGTKFAAAFLAWWGIVAVLAVGLVVVLRRRSQL